MNRQSSLLSKMFLWVVLFSIVGCNKSGDTGSPSPMQTTSKTTITTPTPVAPGKLSASIAVFIKNYYPLSLSDFEVKDQSPKGWFTATVKITNTGDETIQHGDLMLKITTSPKKFLPFLNRKADKIENNVPVKMDQTPKEGKQFTELAPGKTFELVVAIPVAHHLFEKGKTQKALIQLVSTANKKVITEEKFTLKKLPDFISPYDNFSKDLLAGEMVVTSIYIGVLVALLIVVL